MKKYRFWILQISGWLLYFLFNLAVMHPNKLAEGRPLIILKIFLLYFFGFPLSICLRYAYKKIQANSNSPIILTLTIVLSSVLLAFVWFSFDQFIGFLIPNTQNFSGAAFFRFNIWNICGWFLVLLTWSTLYFFTKFWIAWHFQERQSFKANLAAKDAQLKFLHYQIKPHFLFNVLNSIRALIDEDDHKAKTMVTELSEFLRYTILGNNHARVSVGQELNAIQNYLEIQKKRYENNLEIFIEKDPATDKIQILGLLILPLIENALKYGMHTSKMPLKIKISSKLENNSLTFVIFNSGFWLTKPHEPFGKEYSTGTGIFNIRQRLEKEYPNRYSLIILKKEDSVELVLKIELKLSQKLVTN